MPSFFLRRTEREARVVRFSTTNAEMPVGAARRVGDGKTV